MPGFGSPFLGLENGRKLALEVLKDMYGFASLCLACRR
jgi:hypothetical protein